MKDRRGHGNQAYLDQAEDAEMTETDGGKFHRPVGGDSDLGPASEPTSDAASSPSTKGSAGADGLAPAAAADPGAATPSSPVAEASSADTAGQSVAGLTKDALLPTATAPSTSDTGNNAPISVEGSGSAAGNAPTPSNSFVGDDMGWDATAFAEAGGYDAVLSGQMPGMCPEDGGDVFIFIDELNVTNIENTLIQNTEINLIADDGSVIDIGGDFTAIQTQESLVSDGPIGGASSDPAFITDDSSIVEADAMAA